MKQLKIDNGQLTIKKINTDLNFKHSKWMNEAAKGLIIGMVFAVICLLSTSQLYAETYQMHTVQPGESYYSIADEYGVDMNTLQSINSQSNSNLEPGDLIKIEPIPDVKVMVNAVNIPFDTPPYIENGSVFVPIRFVSEALNADTILWNQNTNTAEIKAGSEDVTVTVGSDIAVVNGQTVKLDAPVQLYNGRTFVPVRFFSQVMGVDSIRWNQSTHIVSIVKQGLAVNLNNITPAYSDEDLYWLSRLVEAEAGGEPYEGKIAVADTVINRKNSGLYPNTIKGVIFDTNNGVQYSPVGNGAIYNTPSQNSINAAIQALEGNDVVGNCMYFVNPAIATSTWIEDNRTYYEAIGNHQFYV